MDIPHNCELMGFDNGSYENAVALDQRASWLAEARQDATDVTDSDGQVMDEGTKSQGGVFLFRCQGQTFQPAARWFPEEFPRSLAFVPGRPWLAVALGSRVCVWTIPAGQMIAQLEAGETVASVSISPALRLLACTEKGRVLLFNLTAYIDRNSDRATQGCSSGKSRVGKQLSSKT